MMYIHLGGNVTINNNDIIACFDIDKTTISKVTRNFLKKAQEEKEIVTINERELPKSFIIAEKSSKTKIYLSNLTVQTIMKRNNV